MIETAMRETECERFERLALAAAEGNTLSAEDRFFRVDHRARCEACGAMAKLERYLRATPRDDLDAADPALLDRVLAEATRDDERMRRWAVVSRWSLAVAASVAVVALLWVGLQRVTQRGGGVEGGLPAHALTTRPPVRLLWATGGDVAARQDGALAGSSEILDTAEGRAAYAVGDRARLLLEPHARLRVDSERGGNTLVLRLERGTVLVSADPFSGAGRLSVRTAALEVDVVGTVFRVSTSGPASVEVARGMVEATPKGDRATSVRAGEILSTASHGTQRVSRREVRGMLQAAARLAERPRTGAGWLKIEGAGDCVGVTVDGEPVAELPVLMATRPGLHLVTARCPGALSLHRQVAVTRGSTARVALEPAVPDVSRETKDPPHRIERAPGGPEAAASPSAAMLLARAQQLRARRQYTQAARTLERLMDLHPGSVEAEHGEVALASLQLEHLNQPLAALQNYERYLGGRRVTSFDHEALLGRARALRALGRHAEEAAALRAFLGRFPAALEVEQIEQRLSDLEREPPEKPETTRQAP